MSSENTSAEDIPLIYTKKGNLPMGEMEYVTTWKEASFNLNPVKKLLQIAMEHAYLVALGEFPEDPVQVQVEIGKVLETLEQRGLIYQAVQQAMPPWTKMIETYKQGNEIMRESAHVFMRQGLASDGAAQSFN